MESCTLKNNSEELPSALKSDAMVSPPSIYEHETSWGCVVLQTTTLSKPPEVCFQLQGICTLHSPESAGHVPECSSVVSNHCNMSPKLLEVPFPHCGVCLHAHRLSEHWLSCYVVPYFYTSKSVWASNGNPLSDFTEIIWWCTTIAFL